MNTTPDASRLKCLCMLCIRLRVFFGCVCVFLGLVSQADVRAQAMTRFLCVSVAAAVFMLLLLLLFLMRAFEGDFGW